jgi:hypothetical protein
LLINTPLTELSHITGCDDGTKLSARKEFLRVAGRVRTARLHNDVLVTAGSPSILRVYAII